MLKNNLRINQRMNIVQRIHCTLYMRPILIKLCNFVLTDAHKLQNLLT